MKILSFVLLSLICNEISSQRISELFNSAIASKQNIVFEKEHKILKYLGADSLKISYSESGNYSCGLIQSKNEQYFLYIEDKKAELLFIFDTYDFENSINHALPSTINGQITVTILKKGFEPVMHFTSTTGLIDGFYYLFNSNNSTFAICGDVFSTNKISELKMEELINSYLKMDEIDDESCPTKKLKYFDELRSALSI